MRSSDFRRYLNYLTSKALTLNGIVSEEKDDETLHSLISKEKPEVYECVVEIGDYLFKGYHYKLSSKDEFYLMVHIAKLVNPKTY